MRAFATAFFCLLAGAACAEGLPAFYSVTGVSADDRLNLRAAPNVQGAILGALEPDARGVEVIRFSEDGKWAQLNLSEGVAWASARYLAREEGPEWWQGETALSCHGTEPFWSLVYAPEAGASFTAMGQEAQPLAIAWSALPQGGHLGVLGWRFAGEGAEGFATLRRELCSDGMSDRLYGITLDLFLAGSGAPLGLRGCCALAR